MFYNQEVLGKRKGGFSLYWLAATLGPGSARFKKLSKKELLKCDVQKACQKLIEPDEPLALRLSSNLMLGVTRVYNQQCILLHQDTTTTHSALRQAIVQLKSGITTITDPETGKLVIKKVGKGALAGRGGVGGIDQDREKGRKDVISLRREEGEGLLLGGVGPGLFGGFDDLAWQMMEEELGRGGARGQARLSADPGVGDDFDAHSVRGDDDEYNDGAEKRGRKGKGKEAKPAKTNVARAEDINLPAHLNMEEDQFGLGLDEPNYGFEANLGDDNFELGLDDVAPLPPRPERSLLAPSSSTGAFALPSVDRFAASSSTSAGGMFGREGLPPSPPQEVEMFEGNDFEHGQGGMGMDLDLGLDAERAGSPIAGERRDGEDDAMQVDGEDNARQAKKATPPRDESESVLPTPPPSIEKKKKTKQTKAKKKATVVQDAKTTLESEDLAKARDDYTSEMKKANAVREQTRFEEVQKRRAGEMIGGIPRGVGAPELVAYFEKAFNLDHLSHAPPKRDTKAKKAATAADDREKDSSVLGKRARDDDLRDEDNIIDARRRREREGTAVSSALGRGGARAGSLAPGAGDYEAYQGGMDYDFAGNDFGTDRPTREGSAVPSMTGGPGGRGRAPSFLDESEIGRPRERAASVSYSQQQMPWMQPFPGEEGYSENFGGAGGSSSSTHNFSMRRSLGGSPDRFGARSRSPSVQGSLLRDIHTNRRSATPSILGSQLGRGVRAGTPALGEGGDFEPNFDMNAAAPGDGEDEFKNPARPGSVAGSRDGSLDQDQKAPPASQTSVSFDESENTRIARIEGEAARFLVYAKRQADRERDNELFFSDIVPVASTVPSVAVAAFYHLLVLASQNKLKIKGQEEPYGEILLSIN